MRVKIKSKLKIILGQIRGSIRMFGKGSTLRVGSVAGLSSSSLPRLRGIAGSAQPTVSLLSSFRNLPSTEKRAEVHCNSVGHGPGKRLMP